jgi:predicted ribosome quality control (RQC) complex YloA/Tae2 family protein
MDEVRNKSRQEWNKTMSDAQKIAEKKDEIHQKYEQYKQELGNKIIKQQAKLEQLEQRIRQGQEDEARIKARVELLLEPLKHRNERVEGNHDRSDVLNMQENGLFIANPKVAHAPSTLPSTAINKQVLYVDPVPIIPG